MDDFTFPAATATETPERAPRRLPFPGLAASPLWFPPSFPDAGRAAPAAAARRATAMAEEEEQTAGAGGGAWGAGAAADDVEDRMDMLWEDFNEELAQRRAGSCARAVAPGDGPGPWSESDAESEPAGRAHMLRHGCAPVLRASSRAGGAGHYRRRAGSWVLLMRIFRRLFVIDKTISVAARQRAARAR